MKINWKVRFKNGKWLLSFASLIVAFLYQLLGMFDSVCWSGHRARPNNRGSGRQPQSIKL